MSELTEDDRSMSAPSLGRAQAEFARRFGRRPSVAAWAPGRVNFIGEHTDYNDGFVLPMALERWTVAVAAPAAGRSVTVASTAFTEEIHLDLGSSIARAERGWGNYVSGVLAGCLHAGLDLDGFEAVIDSDVPVGAGLSSSAALEVATATLVERLTGARLEPERKATVCREAEHVFAGVPCGIMDQLIATMAKAGSALLIDCRSREVREVPFAEGAPAVLIANSNVAHDLAAGEFAVRRRECEAAARELGLTSLREASPDELGALDGGSRLYRRARHVVEENARTLAAGEAMETGDWGSLGKLMYASHASLRDLFEVSTREMDTLVDLAAQLGDGGPVYGARMTGAGFGGCTLTLVRRDHLDEVCEHLRRGYLEATGTEPSLFSSRAAAGADGCAL